MVSEIRNTVVAGVFTQNAFAAGPVILCKQVLKRGKRRGQAIVVNSGNANAGVGAKGLRDASAMQRHTAVNLGLAPLEVFVSSTGKIGVPLPIEKVSNGIESAVKTLSPKQFRAAAEAITTTDKAIKVGYISGTFKRRPYTLAAMAKGAGMIAPNMATMLGYAFTDLAITPTFLDRALKQAVERSFNAMSVDGDMSTNDTALVFANGCARNRPINGGRDGDRLIAELTELFVYLAREIVMDGEGATKCLDIRVEGAKSKRQAEALARAIGNSQLVKCACFGGDPNWGRILSAAGAADPSLRPEKVSLSIAGTRVFSHNGPARYSEKTLARRLKHLSDIPIILDLHAGRATARFLASDLTPAYVHFNSAYRT
jgi:glutamate N-acetyltransferase/amino-acid N-acetyltransferase